MPGRPYCSPRAACRNVVLLEARTLGDGASSRAAGMVRAQGGTETAIRLGLRTQEFYAASGDRFPLDCGFVAQGYLMPCFTDAEVAAGARPDRAAAARSASRCSGCPAPRSTTETPVSRRASTLGASYAAGDGYIDAPAQCAGLHRRADRAPRRRPGTLHVHRTAHRGRARGGRRHLRRPDRHRTRRADRRPQAREGGRRGGGENSGRRYPPPGGGDRTGARRSTCTTCRWCST